MKNIAVPIVAHSATRPHSLSKSGGFNQPSLFSSAPAPKAPTLSIERVPQRLAIAPGRLYITSRQGDRFWSYPIQFEQREIDRILPRLQRLNWGLDDDGVPFDVQAIHGTVERMLTGGAA